MNLVEIHVLYKLTTSSPSLLCAARMLNMGPKRHLNDILAANDMYRPVNRMKKKNWLLPVCKFLHNCAFELQIQCTHMQNTILHLLISMSIKL